MRHHLVKAWNLWPPFLGAGIRIERVAPDFREIDVALRLRPWNKNLVGTHFGGSLFAMTDPFFMAMLIENLGREYVVWDKAATIHYRRPGRGVVRTRFALTEAVIDAVRAEVEANGRSEPRFTAQIVDADGVVVAEVEKVLSVKRKRPRDAGPGH
jgi:hypothetical protein